MKHKTLTIICLFILCYVNINAQSYIDISSSNKEITSIASQPQNNTIPDWQKHWTKESVIAINKLIIEYGYPTENSPNRMHWILPGEIKRTITYTENFLFYLPLIANSCNKDSLELIVRKHRY